MDDITRGMSVRFIQGSWRSDFFRRKLSGFRVFSYLCGSQVEKKVE
jgi:hypothetical protein